MPQITDYLLAPWKIFGLLFAPTVQPPPVAATPGAPAAAQVHAGLCYVQNAGDQVLSVCRVGPYEMPSFVLVASILIFLLFLAASLSLLFQCSRLTRLLARMASALGKIENKSQTLTGKELADVRALMHRETLLAPIWDRFEDTLLISGNGEEIFSTEPAETVFSKAALIEENIHSALFNAIPGILTGVGLLMTFVAILDGLSHVSVSANMDVKGIGGLINGLSGKFVSSIVAVTCAVLFVFVERIAYSGPHHAYRKVVHALSSRFKRRTTEHLLHQIQSQLQAHLEANAALVREFHGRLPSAEKAET